MALSFILLGGLLLRLISLNQSFWLDEAITAKTAHFSLSQLGQFLKSDFNPPLYYIIIKWWAKLGGYSEIILRLPSVIFSFLSIYLIFLIAKSFHIKNPLVTSIFLATSPLYLYYSQEARAYSLASFLVLLTVFFFQKSLRQPQNWPLFSLSFLAATFSHYQVWLFWPVFPLYLILKKDSQNLKIFFFACLPTLMALIFYWPIFQNQLQAGGKISAGWSHVIGELSFKNVALIFIKFIIGRISIGKKWLYQIIAAILTPIFWGLAIWGAANPQKKNRFFLGLALFIPLFLAILVSFKIPLLSYFRFLYLLPFFYLLITKGIGQIKSRNWAHFLVWFIAAVNIASSIAYLSIPQFHRENWRGAVAFLKNNFSETPVFIMPQIKSAFEYYNKNQLTMIKANEFGQYSRINLISYGLPIFDPQNKIRSKLKNLGFKLVWGDSFNSVGIEEWEK